jgi:hypothetical protein
VEHSLFFDTYSLPTSTIFFAHEVIRGNPAIRAHLSTHARELAEILGVKLPDGLVAELPSLLFLRAFRENPEGLILDAKERAQVRRILADVHAVLNGKTQRRLTSSIVPLASPDAFLGLPRLLDRHWLPLLILFGLAVVLFLGERLFVSLRFLLYGLVNFEKLDLQRKSDDFLDDLTYQQSREASAGFSFRGFNLGGKRTVTARAMTLQGLTGRYLDYAKAVRRAYNGKLIVIIDELDKITDPAEVRDLLIELKGALFEKGCYYIISLSEDCARAFRGRLAEGRDIFESSFDDVIDIPGLDFAEAREMVKSRAPDAAITPEAVDIITAFAGGIPREIVRYARLMVIDLPEPRPTSAGDVGLAILKDAADDWAGQAVRAPVNGTVAIDIYLSAQAVTDAIKAAPGAVPWPDAIATGLIGVIDLLDPVGYFRALPATADHDSTTAAILRELQGTIRLLVMEAHMHRLHGAPDPESEIGPDTLKIVREAMRVLPEQPMLALELARTVRGDPIIPPPPPGSPRGAP